MKRLIMALTGLLLTSVVLAASLNEDFETGLPTSAPKTPTSVELSSGTWTVMDCYGDKNNGSLRCRMNTNGYVITPMLCQPGSITFKHRGSGSNKELVVEKSTDGGVTWSQVGSVKVNSASAYGSSSFNAASAEEDTEVLIRFTCKSASIFIDDVAIELNTVSGGGDDGDDPYPGNQEPQDTIEWTGPHSVEHCIYVAPWGNDKGDGSWENPLYNLQLAVNKAVPGDTIYVRGGTYYPNYMADGSKTTIRLNKSGTAEQRYTIKTFPGEFPVLNFKSQPKGKSVRGIQLNGDYWHIYGLHITQAGDNGIKLEGSHNIIERCTFSYNDDTGLQLGFGHSFSDSHPGISSNDGSYCAWNDIIDCDSYLNCDSDNRGSDADGFACKMHNGKGNRFIRCRAWHNSDDAWDLYETDYSVKLIECWAWASGKAEDFGWVENMSGGSFQGNGNGIKLGGNGSGGSSKGIHEAWRCVAFNCNKTGSVKGFDQNSHSDGVLLVNCLAFGNGYDFMFERGGDNLAFYNNVCFGKIEIASNHQESSNAMLSTTDKGWQNVVRGFSESDYVSLTEADAMAPRSADGSLPTRFARLKKGSMLIDKGVDMKSELQEEFPFTWQPVSGAARDLGPYEYEQPMPTGTQMLLTPNKQLSLAVNAGSVKFSVPTDGRVCVDLLSPQGNCVATVAHLLATGGAEYTLPLSAKPGVYLLRLTHQGRTATVKVAVR